MSMKRMQKHRSWKVMKWNFKAFVKKAVEVLPQNEQEKVIDNLRWLFDEKTAKEIVEEK